MSIRSITKDFDDLRASMQHNSKIVTRLSILFALSVCLNIALLILLIIH